MKDLYNENFKSLKKDIEEGTKLWKDSHTHAFVELCRENDLSTQSNLQIQYNPNQNSHNMLHRNREDHPKIHMELQKTPGGKNNPKQKEQRWSNHQNNRAPVIKTVQFWLRNTQTDPHSKTQGPNMSTHNYNHLRFDKDAKTYVEEGEGNILPEAFRGQAEAFLSGEQAELYMNTVHTDETIGKSIMETTDTHWRADSIANKW